MLDGASLVPKGPPKVKRRVRIPDKPNYSLNLWSIMKNCIGRELSKIPMPVRAGAGSRSRLRGLLVCVGERSWPLRSTSSPGVIFLMTPEEHVTNDQIMFNDVAKIPLRTEVSGSGGRS